jgi:hypothetical protein
MQEDPVHSSECLEAHWSTNSRVLIKNAQVQAGCLQILSRLPGSVSIFTNLHTRRLCIKETQAERVSLINLHTLLFSSCPSYWL